MKHKILVFFMVMAFGAQAQTTVIDSIYYGGMYRNYRLYVPAIYTGSAAVPLVLNLHGYTSNAWQQQLYGDFSPIADTANFLVLHPNGTGSPQFWNAGLTSSPDDQGFLSALIDSLALTYNIDGDRLYSCGMSNGGIMSYYMACELYGKFAAIGSVTGTMTHTMHAGCTPAGPMPVIEIHGTADGTVPYNGSGTFRPIDSIVKFWAQHNHTDPAPVVSNYPNVSTSDFCTATEYAYLDGDYGSQVVLVKITGGGHTWPGAPVDVGVTNHDFDASVRLWDFFRQFKKSQFTGMGEIGNKNKTTFSVYPNPVTDLLTVKNIKPGDKVFVYEIKSGLVYTGTATEDHMYINLKTWKPGVYGVLSGGKTVKFIKQ